MKSFTTIFTCIICLLASAGIAKSDGLNNVSDTSGILQKRLEWFQDQKFGVFTSLGIRQLWGTSPWILNVDPSGTDPMGRDSRRPNWDFDMGVLRKGYWNLIKGFYPRHFDAEEWSRIIKDAGAKYAAFYCKHHDGFSMFDTQLSDFKITSPECPYSDHPNPDVTARLCDAFRQAGLGVTLIFSYSDWHSPYYWSPNAPVLNRHYNYDINKEPERWQKFVDFLHGQIRELMTGYGKIDILWLDGGWDKKDMQVGKMVEMARSHQLELIVVSRGGNVHEDFKTPENRVPPKPLGGPWETFWSMGDDTTQELIHLLVDIVCKGGNLLLSAALNSDGTITPSCVERLKQMGEWLKANGEAIYGTRMYSQYRDANICYTQKGNYVYAIYLDEARDSVEQSTLPAQVTIKHIRPIPGSKIFLLGVEEPLKWKASGGGITITVPGAVMKSPPARYAYSFRVQVSR
ncbi:MAG: alpha-L-fucosidase [Cyclobacteriaceae bacterium]